MLTPEIIATREATLAAHLVMQLGADPSILDEATLARLRAHGWPGNVRELRNARSAP